MSFVLRTAVGVLVGITTFAAAAEPPKLYDQLPEGRATFVPQPQVLHLDLSRNDRPSFALGELAYTPNVESLIVAGAPL